MSAGDEKRPPFLAALISGGIAGTSVDVALYPLDTIKTRLQSSRGFIKAGGFAGVYKGLSAAAVGSAPGAALFFSTYEMMKGQLHGRLPEPMVHMMAAACGETAACLVRVPTEVVKQRMQAGLSSSALGTVRGILAREGGVLGLYQGFGITLMREIPFAFIQFPIYEFAKNCISRWNDGRTPHSYEAALCGSFSGGIAAALTTPLDVVKTRLMLGADSEGVPYKGPLDTFMRVRAEGAASPRGIGIFFAGVQPRVMWISIGGFVFFGAYDQALRVTRPLFE
ncbi:mitochondrial substrate carrier [Ochromonadaceae sp. CCMP2298]|nr:mitochondrial substrate carrier [Ochromonadaceae sp. CCMP2298]